MPHDLITLPGLTLGLLLGLLLPPVWRGLRRRRPRHLRFHGVRRRHPHTQEAPPHDPR